MRTKRLSVEQKLDNWVNCIVIIVHADEKLYKQCCAPGRAVVPWLMQSSALVATRAMVATNSAVAQDRSRRLLSLLCNVYQQGQHTCSKMYENWSKEDLIAKVIQLETHVQQLKNVIAKSRVSSFSVLWRVCHFTCCSKSSGNRVRWPLRKCDGRSRAPLRRIVFLIVVILLSIKFQMLVFGEKMTYCIAAINYLPAWRGLPKSDLTDIVLQLSSFRWQPTIFYFYPSG